MKETLRLLREQNNFSQAKISEYLGVSRQIYLKYESGEVEPGIRIIKALCQLYKVSYDTIIENKLHKPKPVEYSFSDSEIKIAEPELQLFTCNSFFTPEDALYFNKLKRFSQEKKEIVYNLIDSLFSLNDTCQNENNSLRKAGGLSGNFYIADDFDETPNCFGDYIPEAKC